MARLPTVAHTYLRPMCFLLLGDSITQLSFNPNGGWGATLADAYIRRADVVNKGFSGYTTATVRLALDRILESAAIPAVFKPDFATIFLGANDAALPNSLGGQHVPLEDYKDNLRFIAKKLLSINPKIKIAFIAPPPLDDERFMETMRAKWGQVATGPNRTKRVTDSYASACEKVASSMSCPCFNLARDMVEPDKSPLASYLQEVKIARWQDYLNDGLHLSSQGNRFVAAGLLGLIREHYQDLIPENLPLFLPPFPEIDFNLDDPFAKR